MLIGLHGCKQVGKDTAAQWLIDELDYIKIAFADKLKESVAELFMLDRDNVDRLKEMMAHVEIRHPMSAESIAFTWRIFLQRYGTEAHRRVFGDNFWVDQWERTYDELYERDPSAAERVVVTDCRFRNEAIRIHKLGGCIIEIRRPGFEPDGHASEEPLDEDLIDACIYNDSSIEAYRRRFLAVVHSLNAGVSA